jgi:hypothetical protein
MRWREEGGGGGNYTGRHNPNHHHHRDPAHGPPGTSGRDVGGSGFPGFAGRYAGQSHDHPQAAPSQPLTAGPPPLTAGPASWQRQLFSGAGAGTPPPWGTPGALFDATNFQTLGAPASGAAQQQHKQQQQQPSAGQMQSHAAAGMRGALDGGDAAPSGTSQWQPAASAAAQQQQFSGAHTQAQPAAPWSLTDNAGGGGRPGKRLRTFEHCGGAWAGSSAGAGGPWAQSQFAATQQQPAWRAPGEHQPQHQQPQHQPQQHQQHQHQQQRQPQPPQPQHSQRVFEVVQQYATSGTRCFDMHVPSLTLLMPALQPHGSGAGGSGGSWVLRKASFLCPEAPGRIALPGVTCVRDVTYSDHHKLAALATQVAGGGCRALWSDALVHACCRAVPGRTRVATAACTAADTPPQHTHARTHRRPFSLSRARRATPDACLPAHRAPACSWCLHTATASQRRTTWGVRCGA